MTILQKLITSVFIGIDRITFSIPIAYKDALINHLNRTCTPTLTYAPKHYWHHEYIYSGNKITVTTKQPIKDFITYNPRTYLSVYNPRIETQNYLKNILSLVSRNKHTGLNAIIINQLEVSYDFYTNSDADTDHNIQLIKQYIDNRFFLKYSRPDSYCTICDNNIDKRTNCLEFITNYVGRKGNVRNGSKGTRSYIKTENGNTFFRYEVQFNRAYLKKNNITFNSLPLNPLHFQIFDHINILGNFSTKGIKNLARSILRKKGATQSTTPDFNKLHRNTANLVRFQVLGGSRGLTRSIPSQIAQLKAIKQKAGLSVNPMQYFPVQHDVHQLICCHASIGYPEENCSKRLLLCQME